jgi:biotin carboxyl carrier protein
MILELELSGKKHRADITIREGKYVLRLDGAEAEEIDASFPEPGIVHFLLHGESYEFHVEGANGELNLDLQGKKVSISVRDPRSLRSRRASASGEAGPMKITAPMPGKVVRIIAPQGTEVEAGAGVIVIEAMKMQNELKSPKAGTVQRITVIEGATVNPGDVLAVIE